SIAVRKLAAVRLVDRPRRGTHIVARCHIVPPESFGACKAPFVFFAGLPVLLPPDKPIRLTPQQDFHLVAEQPAVSNNAVVLRQSSRHESSLDAASDSRRHRIQRYHAAIAGQRRKPRSQWPQMPWRQSDY